MKAKVTLLIVLSLLTSTSYAGTKCYPKQHAKIPTGIVDQTYHKARKMLLASGWQPLQTIPDNEAEDNPNISSDGNGKTYWEKGYVEVQACAGTGMAPCAFLFKDAYGNKLGVFTKGEEDPEYKAYARVSTYKFECE